MKQILKRVIVLALLGAAVWYAWTNRHHIALLDNNNVRMSGMWYQVSMNFKEDVAYSFDEGFITREGYEYGTYTLRKNTDLEVTIGDRVTRYQLEFEDDDNMIWLTETPKGLVKSVHWRR
jgi:hypothetical protein